MTDRADENSAHARRPPSTLRLLLLVLEGYAYIALVVAVLIGAPLLLVLGVLSRRPFVGLIAVFVGVPMLLLARTAVRALLFRVPDPDGVPVSANDAPALHAEVATIRQAIGAPHVDEILVIGSFNASALQAPRFGVFWPRNYLLIGLPLFTTLSPEQMRAVIAHELAHLSRAHGRLSLLVYRLRVSWTRLLHALDISTPTFAILLFRWYAPRLHAQSTSLARRHELLVDRLAVQVAGKDATADSIVALGVVGSLYEDALWSEPLDDGDAVGPFSRKQPDVWALVAAKGQETLETLLSQTTEPGDTHPALGERLGSIGATARIPAPPDRTVGDAWLGTQLTVLATRLDDQWLVARGDAWRRQRDERREARERLVELEGVATPTPAQLYEKAQLIELLDDIDAAIPVYEAASDAAHAGAALALGCILLDRDDERGIAVIERAVAADASLGEEGNRQIAEFLESRGRPVEANRYAALAQAAATRAALAAAERREVSQIDRFTAHGLDQSALDPIRASLARTSEVHAALLVRKELRYSSGAQLVLAVEANGAPPALRDQLVAARILPVEGTIVMLGRLDAPLRQALKAVPGAEIYRRT